MTNNYKSHEAWANAAEKKLDDGNLKQTTQSQGWLFREAYYDNYDLDRAVGIATDPNQKFSNPTVGWRVPKGKRAK